MISQMETPAEQWRQLWSTTRNSHQKKNNKKRYKKQKIQQNNRKITRAPTYNQLTIHGEI